MLLKNLKKFRHKFGLKNSSHTKHISHSVCIFVGFLLVSLLDVIFLSRWRLCKRAIGSGAALKYILLNIMKDFYKIQEKRTSHVVVISLKNTSNNITLTVKLI